MKRALQFYIDGEWVDPIGECQSIQVVNPANEQVIGRVAIGGKRDVDRAVRAARAAFESYSTTSVDDRIGLLEAVLKAYKKRLDDVAHAIKITMGAPTELARGDQAGSGTLHLKATIKALKSYAFEQQFPASILRREAVGVCGLITPWNWPANQIACKVAPALAAGCTMVLKPSEMTPFDAVYWAECLHEAGAPAGVFNLIQGDGVLTGAALSNHADVDMISFTGSTRAGALITTAGASTVKRVALELGGKSPNLILSDADIEQAVRRGVEMCFQNTGQSCDAPTRMLVPHDKMDAAAEIAIKAAEQLTVGDPDAVDVFMGPLASEVQYERVQSMIKKGLDEGAQLATGGVGRPDGLSKGFYVKPTVFTHVTNDMTVARDEIFGPVLCIIGYENDQDAIDIANDSPYGLSSYVSAGDLDRAYRIGKKLRAGMVHINGAELDEMAPFGGYKQSGNGREYGSFGIDEFVELKSIVGARP